MGLAIGRWERCGRRRERYSTKWAIGIHWKTLRAYSSSPFVAYADVQSRKSGGLAFDAMDTFMEWVLSSINEHGARAVRVFPPASHVLLAFADRIASEVVSCRFPCFATNLIRFRLAIMSHRCFREHGSFLRIPTSSPSPHRFERASGWSTRFWRPRVSVLMQTFRRRWRRTLCASSVIL